MAAEMTKALRRCMRPALAAALLLCVAGAGAQELFKWVDKKGVTHYSDTPPPSGKARVIKPNGGTVPAGTSPAVALPYELARAARSQPVILYSTANCAACDQGRALLASRGIPFVEKTVTSDADKRQLEQAGGSGQVPLLLVGANKVVGFESGSWNDALSNAAYPAEARLPAAYRNPPAEAAAAPRQPVPAPSDEVPPAAARATTAASTPPPPPATTPANTPRPPNTPPGFRF